MVAATFAQIMLVASAATAVLAFPVTVVSKIGENVVCHIDTLTVFVGFDRMDVANGRSVTIHTAGGFGIQENGWYWRGKRAQASEQNPDNAGMQVDVSSGSCKAQTSASWAGGAVPDAQRLLSLNSFADGNGGCTVEVYRKTDTDLCVAGSGSKQCCAPCTVFPGGSCCTRDADGGKTTCPSPSPPAPPTPAPEPAQCEMRAGMDVQVTAYLKIAASSPDECCTACSADSRCKVVVFNTDHCSLKDSVRLVDSSSQFVTVFPNSTMRPRSSAQEVAV